ncbi:MAG: hypothetical protein WA061_00460 [Microgenomates group bacterium]
MAGIAVELTKEPFKRHHHLNQAGGLVAFGYMNMVRLVYFYDDETGQDGYRPAKGAPIPLDTLAHMPLKDLIPDTPWAMPSLATALKEGASTRHVDTNAAFVARGGTLESPLKASGFAIRQSIQAMIKEQEQKKLTIKHGPELASVIQGAQKHSEKTGGHFSSRTALDLLKKKHQKQYRKREATKQKKNQYLEFP